MKGQKYVCARNPLDGLYRVVEMGEEPYGMAYSVGKTPDDAINDGAILLGINPKDIEVI